MGDHIVRLACIDDHQIARPQRMPPVADQRLCFAVHPVQQFNILVKMRNQRRGRVGARPQPHKYALYRLRPPVDSGERFLPKLHNDPLLRFFEIRKKLIEACKYMIAHFCAICYTEITKKSQED